MIALHLAPVAVAQEAGAWRPAAGAAFGRGGMRTESARVAEDEAAVGLTGVLAEGDAVGGLGLLAVGSVAAGDRVRVDLAVPAWLHAEAPGFSGPAAGDVAARAVVPIARGKVVFSLIPQVVLPTGTDAAGLAGGPGAGLLLALAGGDRFDWALDGGAAWAAPGSTVDLAASGAWAALPGFRVGAEVTGAVGIDRASRGDALAFAQVLRRDGLALAIAGGPAIGPVEPRSRIHATLSWSRTADAGVEGVEGVQTGPDADGDGVADADACPTLAEDRDGWLDDDGCPETDNDADTVADADDRCPLVAGAPRDAGCPDADADGAHDGIDACPTRPGPANERPDVADGCPKRAWATSRRLLLADPVQFDPSGGLLGGADGLAEAAAYLVLHPELGPVEVAGHVARGWTEEEGIAVSRARAERVRDVLVLAGVPAARLTAVGYGSTRPLDTNRIASGRARNERIELVLVEPP